ncbi:MAG: DinB family protein [Chloroflexota bacterium]
MNADAFRQLYEYHFVENRKIWNSSIAPLSQEQFLQPVAYSLGSVRNQVVHFMSADDYWFSGLRGLEMPEMLNPESMDDRQAIRAYWDNVEQQIRDYLANLRDDMLFNHPLQGGDEILVLWQVLMQGIIHGADHRAQLLRLLNDLGAKTGPQDYIFYVFDHAQDQ